MNGDINGFRFPFRIDPATGGVSQADGITKIRQNIRVLLGTRVGERPMDREYGTRLHSLVQDPNDDVLSELLVSKAQEAIIRYEPRVFVAGATVEQDEGEVRMRLEYVRTTQPTAGQMVVPLR
jgi:phage baseplate assembly protein W